MKYLLFLVSFFSAMDVSGSYTLEIVAQTTISAAASDLTLDRIEAYVDGSSKAFYLPFSLTKNIENGKKTFNLRVYASINARATTSIRVELYFLNFNMVSKNMRVTNSDQSIKMDLGELSLTDVSIAKIYTVTKGTNDNLKKNFYLVNIVNNSNKILRLTDLSIAGYGYYNSGINCERPAPFTSIYNIDSKIAVQRVATDSISFYGSYSEGIDKKAERIVIDGDIAISECSHRKRFRMHIPCDISVPIGGNYCAKIYLPEILNVDRPGKIEYWEDRNNNTGDLSDYIIYRFRLWDKNDHTVLLGYIYPCNNNYTPDDY